MRDSAEIQLFQLAIELLTAYERAAELRQDPCAEQVLLALEELARSSPACGAVLDQAYLRRVRGAVDR